MSFFKLARKSALRKPLRSLLLILSVGMAFLIHGVTASFINGTQGTEAASDTLLGVMSATGGPLPMAYLPRIEALEGIAAVSPVMRLRGSIGDARNVIAVTAGDPERLMEVSGKELGLTPALSGALQTGRDKVLVGRALATAQNWTVGDRLTLKAFHVKHRGEDPDWHFEIAGIFDGASPSTDTYFMIAQYDYINLGRERGADTASTFALKPDAGVSPQKLAADIDALFANSAAPTRTMSEKQFLSAFLSQYADVKQVVTLVVGASFITLLMIVTNTMIFALRERRFEIGVLKVLGLRSWHILLMVLAEALLVFVIGGLIGLGLAKVASLIAPAELGLVLGLSTALQSALFIVLLGLIAGLLPALSAMRTPILSAFKMR